MVRHLAKRGYLAMLKLYADESYSHPPAPLVYTIAAYVSPSYRWERFEREWDKTLTAYGVDHFHMKDFAAKKGVYANWPEKTRIKFLRTLQHVIKSNTEKDFAVSVVVEDYDKLIPPKTNLRMGFGEPHVFAVIGCMKNIGVWQKSAHINKPIHYVFEAGSGYDSMLKRCFADLDDEQIDYYRAGGGLSFFGKNVTPLQAADMLAYENRLEMCRQVNPTNRRKTRESLRNLVRKENDWMYYREENIRTVLEIAADKGLIQRVEQPEAQ